MISDYLGRALGRAWFPETILFLVRPFSESPGSVNPTPGPPLKPHHINQHIYVLPIQPLRVVHSTPWEMKDSTAHTNARKRSIRIQFQLGEAGFGPPNPSTPTLTICAAMVGKHALYNYCGTMFLVLPLSTNPPCTPHPETPKRHFIQYIIFRAAQSCLLFPSI